MHPLQTGFFKSLIGHHALVFSLIRYISTSAELRFHTPNSLALLSETGNNPPRATERSLVLLQFGEKALTLLEQRAIMEKDVSSL
jgi:hypothetical protein